MKYEVGVHIPSFSCEYGFVLELVFEESSLYIEWSWYFCQKSIDPTCMGYLRSLNYIILVYISVPMPVKSL